MKSFATILKILIILFAIVGLIFTLVFLGIKFGWTNVRGTIQERNNALMINTSKFKKHNTKYIAPTEWSQSEEWQVLKSAFERDKENILRASIDADISPRILLGGVMGEQFRFFSNSRESFKSYFEPLKILASLSSFSYGIAGLKPETVARIEENLKNPTSVFYLGEDFENIITYPENADIKKTQFERITDTKNTYYSYLYVGLFMRQASAQWAQKGFDISNKPGILATLYNLGFNRSIPKENPQIGGAPITLGDETYSFGQIAEEFYYSEELRDIFPY
jgi:hypothetical protein